MKQILQFALKYNLKQVTCTKYHLQHALRHCLNLEAIDFARALCALTQYHSVKILYDLQKKGIKKYFFAQKFIISTKLY